MRGGSEWAREGGRGGPNGGRIFSKDVYIIVFYCFFEAAFRRKLKGARAASDGARGRARGERGSEGGLGRTHFETSIQHLYREINIYIYIVTVNSSSVGQLSPVAHIIHMYNSIVLLQVLRARGKPLLQSE